MGNFIDKSIRESKRIGHQLTGGIFKKPKTPAKTAQETELEDRQRKQIDELTREQNQRLKAIKRGAVGRQSLLGGGGARGVTSDTLGGGGGRRGGTGAAARPGRGGGRGGGGGGRGGSRAGILGRTR